MGIEESIDVDTLQKAKELERELGSSVAHIVNKKVVEAGKKIVDFSEEIQHSAVEEVGEMLKS